MPGAIAETERLAAADPDVFLPRQFTNPDNAVAHELRTGPELLDAVAGRGAARRVRGRGGHRRHAHGRGPGGAAGRPGGGRGPGGGGGGDGRRRAGRARLPGHPGVVDCLSGLLDEAELGGHPPLAVPRPRRWTPPASWPVGVPGRSVQRPQPGRRPARWPLALGPGHHVATVACDRMERYFSTDLFDDLGLPLTGLVAQCCKWGSLWHRSLSRRDQDEVRTGRDAGEVEIGGTVEPGFEGVREAFARNFAEHGEVGAGSPLVRRRPHGGRPVGRRGRRRHAAPYTEDTLQLVFSTTKGATAICANLLAQRGELDVDAPVAEYWPEFARPARARSRSAGCCATRPACPTSTATLELDECLAWDPAGRGAGRHGARSGSRARPTATTPSPTAGWWARSSAASPARASAPSSPTRWPARWASSSGSACPTTSRPGSPR